MKKLIIILLICLCIYIPSAYYTYNGVHKSYYDKEGFNYNLSFKPTPNLSDVMTVFMPIVNTMEAIDFLFFDRWKAFQYRNVSFFK